MVGCCNYLFHWVDGSWPLVWCAHLSMDDCGLIRISHAVGLQKQFQLLRCRYQDHVLLPWVPSWQAQGGTEGEVYPGEAVAFPCFCPSCRETRKRSCVGFVLLEYLESQLPHRPSEPGISKCLGRKKLQTCPVLKCQCLQLSTVVSWDADVLWFGGSI